MVLRNLLAFQAAWVVGVTGAAQGYPWLGPLVTLPLLAYHFSCVRQPGREAAFLLAVALLGCMLDQLFVSSGLLSYTGTSHPARIPAWIVGLWLGFATTLNSSLRWLQGRPAIAAVSGLAGGPLSYWAASRLGAVEMSDAFPALAAIAMAWAMIMPLLCLLAERFASLPGRMRDV